jgi:hypothetical protein
VDDLDATVENGSVTLRVSGTDELELEVWGARRKRGLFEKVFERRLEIVEEVPSRRAG